MADTMNANEMQNKLEKLSKLDRREYFVINTDFECQFSCKDNSKGPAFSEWRKDSNSLSMFAESEQLIVVHRNDCTKHYIGSVQLQRDLALNDGKLFASLWLKDLSSKSDGPKWDKMIVVTSLCVMH